MKWKRHGQSPEELYARAKQELENGNAKDALKNARVCHRAEATPERRHLLERALLARAQQLHRTRFIAEARNVLDELAALPPTIAEVSQQLARLRVLLGQEVAETSQVLADDPTLLVQMTDEAVLDPRSPMPSHAEVPRQIEQIRKALSHVEHGADVEVGPLLQDIPRSSPLCDWKLFVRGLLAFYQRAPERAEENWRRLDPARPASRIARTLQAAAEPSGTENLPPEIAASRQRLLQRLQDPVVVSSVKRLNDHWQKGAMRDFLREFRKLWQSSAKTHASLLRSILDMAWKRAVHDGDQRMFNELARNSPSPALDPGWNRFRMLMTRGYTDLDSLAKFESFGKAYAADLIRMESLAPAERPIAAAIAYQFMARSMICFGAQHVRQYMPFATDETAQRPWLQSAALALRKSIEHYARLESAYLELAEVHVRLGQPDKATAVLEKLVGVNPEQYEARSQIANYYLERDEPDKSEPHVEAAARVLPRDPRTVTLRWNQRVTMIRCLILKRDFEAARQELGRVGAVVPADTEPYTLMLSWAGLELKARRQEAAQQYLDAALATIEDPAPIWMQMSYIADRYKLPAAVRRSYDSLYKKAMQSAPTGPTVARLARFLWKIRLTQTNYTGRIAQQRLLVKYLRKARPVSFAEDELRDICRFLSNLEDRDWQFREKFITAGARQYPDNATLQLLAGEFEIEQGLVLCDFDKARECLQRAFELASGSGAAADAFIAERAQSALALLTSKASLFNGAFFDGDDDDPPCDCEACRRERAREERGEYGDDGEERDMDVGEYEPGQIGMSEAEQFRAFLGVLGDMLPPEMREALRKLRVDDDDSSAGRRKRSPDRATKRQR